MAETLNFKSAGATRRRPRDEQTPDTFFEREITITLTGAEWFAYIARVLGKPLSAEGARLYSQAGEKIQQQLSAA